MKLKLIKQLNDFRFRIIVSTIFILVSISNLITEPYDGTYGGIFPASIYAFFALFPVIWKRRIYPIIIRMARKKGVSDRRIYFYLILGLHGKLLGINVTPKSILKWSIMVIGYTIWVIWLLQSEISFTFKTILFAITTYKLIRNLNS